MSAPETCGARPCERAAGERDKLRALALLTAHRRTDVIRARRALLRRLLETGRATIDDVRPELGPLSRRPTWLGAVPGELRDAGIIRRAGYCETHRAAAHARPVSIWELADRDKALRWLADNPADDRAADAGGVGTGGGIPWTYLAVCCAVNHAAAAPITICV